MQALAEELGVALEELRRWLDGSREPPVEAFVRALDIVAKGALHPKAEQRSKLRRDKSPDLLSQLTAIEELLRAPQTGNAEKAAKLALSVARSAASRAISELAMQVVTEADRLSRDDSARRAGDERLDEALSSLRAALERARGVSSGSGDP